MLKNISLENISVMLQMLPIILLLLFVEEGTQAAPPCPPPPPGAWGIWMGCNDLWWTTKALCSVKDTEPITPQRSRHRELDQKQKNKVCSNANYLRELTLSIIPAPPPSLKKGLSSCQRLFSFIYCSASGCQPQSLSKLLIIKYYLFLHFRKLWKPTNSLETTVRGLKDL